MSRLNADDRRDSFIDATIAVMIEKGFAHATTRDVAAKVGVGRGLLHHYFATWPDLQRAALHFMAKTAQQEAEAALADLQPAHALDTLLSLILADPDDGYWRLFADGWDEAQRDNEIAKLYISMSQYWRRKLSDIIARGIVTAEFRCVDPAGASWRLTALADGLSSHILLANAEITRGEALTMLCNAARQELQF
jgi:AcrR family transcriptional regulator